MSIVRAVLHSMNWPCGGLNGHKLGRGDEGMMVDVRALSDSATGNQGAYDHSATTCVTVDRGEHDIPWEAWASRARAPRRRGHARVPRYSEGF